MRQTDRPGAPYASLLARVRRDLDPVVDEVARDIAGPGETAADVAGQARRAVEWTLAVLEAGLELTAAELERLRAEGGRAARSGETLQRLLDRYLSSGWAVWGASLHGGAVTEDALDPGEIAALGTALLKAGDAAAAALAAGHGVAEREIAARTASARREFLAEILTLPPDDPAAIGRVSRRAAHFGLDPADRYRVVVATVGHDVEDDAPELGRIGAAIDRPVRALAGGRAAAGPLLGTTGGRIVVLARAAWPGVASLDRTLDELSEGGWLAIDTPDIEGLARVAPAFGAVLGALRVGERCGLHGRIAVGALALERALLADEVVLDAAIERELGPILRAPRIGDALLVTLEAYLELGQNLRATARALGLGARTVSYRLRRIETLLGRRLEGDLVLRLAAALLARRLVSGPAGAPRAALGGRSPRRRAGSRAT